MCTGDRVVRISRNNNPTESRQAGTQTRTQSEFRSSNSENDWVIIESSYFRTCRVASLRSFSLAIRMRRFRQNIGEGMVRNRCTQDSRWETMLPILSRMWQ